MALLIRVKSTIFSFKTRFNYKLLTGKDQLCNYSYFLIGTLKLGRINVKNIYKKNRTKGTVVNDWPHVPALVTSKVQKNQETPSTTTWFSTSTPPLPTSHPYRTTPVARVERVKQSGPWIPCSRIRGWRREEWCDLCGRPTATQLDDISRPTGPHAEICDKTTQHVAGLFHPPAVPRAVYSQIYIDRVNYSYHGEFRTLTVGRHRSSFPDTFWVVFRKYLSVHSQPLCLHRWTYMLTKFTPHIYFGSQYEPEILF